MRKNQQTDKNLRQLEATSLIMPSEHIWGNIEHELDGGKSKKAVWFWSLGCLCAALLGSMAWIGFSEQPNPTPSTAPIVSNDNSSVETSSTESLSVDKQYVESTKQPRRATFDKNHASTNFIKTKIWNTPSSKNSFSESVEHKTVPEKIDSESATFGVEETFPTEKVEMAVVNNSEDNLPPTPEVVIAKIPKVSETSINTENEIIPEDDPCPALDNKIKKHFFIEAGGLLGRHDKQFASVNEGTTSLREQTESAWYTWGGFAGIGIYLKPNLYLSTNLDIVQQKDLFDYSITGISRMVVEYDPATGERLNTYTETGSLQSEGEITRTTVDAGLNIGYLFGNGRAYKNAWQFGVEPGLLYNFSLQSNGKVMMPDNSISRVENENLYENSLGLGYQVHLVAVKNMRKGLQLNIKPFYRNYVDSWASNGNEDLDIPALGVKLGLRKIF